MVRIDAQVQQPSVHRAYLVPSSTTAKAGESEALEVLSFILGHGTTSRLYRTLVVERELAIGAGGYYNGTALDASEFGFYGSPKPGVTLPKLEDAIDAVIDAVIAKNQDKLAEYRAGKDKLFGFFVGQVMKESGGKANPALVNQALKVKLAG